MRSRVTIGLALLVALVVMSYLLLRRNPSTAAPEPSEGAAVDDTYGLDPWLLADGFADRVVVEIDWVAGGKPGPRTLSRLQETLVKYGPPGRSVQLLLDDEIPSQAWEETRGARDRVTPLVQRFADLADESHDRESGVELCYAIFVPDLLGSARPWLAGYSTMWPVRRGGEIRARRGVVISRILHGHYARLWSLVDRRQSMLIVHEFGHQFGLVNNTAHLAEEPQRVHCTSPSCAMAARTKSNVPYLRKLFSSPDYCERCQTDIRSAQAVWRRRLAADPGYRAQLAAASEGSSGRWTLALELIPGGHHAEALELIDGVVLAARDDYEFEQLSIVRQWVLEALGRFSEAAQVSDELLARGRLVSFFPERVRVQRARLLRRAGRLEEALAAARAGLADESTRHLWRVTAATILSATGRSDEAQTLRREALGRARASEAQAGTDVERQIAALEVAQIHAALGEGNPARAALERVGSYPPESIAVLATLGDLDRAAELLRKRDGSAMSDPCRVEELTPMLAEERFADVLGHCPLAVGHDGSGRTAP